jgi:hypothetical protein
MAVDNPASDVHLTRAPEPSTVDDAASAIST